MKKLIVYSSILCIVSVAIIISFIINNNDKKSQEISINLQKTYSLSEDITLTSNIFVKDDKVYILDYFSKILFVLNNQFEIDFRLDKNGPGPGEFLSPSFAYDDIAKKQISVIDIDKLKEIHFDYTGKYLSQTPMEDFEMCYKQLSVKDGIVKNIFQIKFEDNKMVNIGRISLVSNDNVITLWEDIKAPKDFILPKFCCSLETIYISKNSENHYSINVYDNNGNLLSKITKAYSRIKKNREEIEYEMLINGNDDNANQYYKEFHLSIRQMFYYNKKLWVLTQDEESAYFDIIDIEGRFAGQVFLSRKITGEFFIFKDTICELFMNDDETFKINRYSLDNFLQ
jgi:6-bladed beta-propeller